MRLTLILLAIATAFGQPSTPPEQPGPQSWRFTCDYYYLDTKGNLGRRERLTARYTRSLPKDNIKWTDVELANGTEWADKFNPAEKRAFMEGFSYPRAEVKNMLTPEFFRGFPPMAMIERNLVWDTHMLEGFAQDQFEHLKLNTPYHVPGAENVEIGGAGAFRHRDLQLIWTGYSKRNAIECAVIDYRAFFNTIDMKNPAMTLNGRSNYWGQIWVSLATRRIEYATLYEDVIGEMTFQGQDKPQTISVFRIGVFEPSK